MAGALIGTLSLAGKERLPDSLGIGMIFLFMSEYVDSISMK